MLLSKVKTMKGAISSVFRTERNVKEIMHMLEHPVRPVLLNDFKRTAPISSDFGFSRGTPIDRYYIEKFLRNHKDAVKGNLLEVADDGYIRKYGQSGSTYSILQFTPDSNAMASSVNLVATQSAASSGGGLLSSVQILLD